MNFRAYLKKTTCLLLLTLGCYSIQAQEEVDILIIGGGAGGTSAAIQVARMDVKVLIIESTPWLGGMLTSAGVSAIDGNHNMPSGIWGEFRQKLYDYYGGTDKLSTGWVSHTLFEPSVGNSILQEMAQLENLSIAFNAEYKAITKENDHWLVTYKQKRKLKTVKAKLLIDATEIGELLPLVGADFRLGMDAKSDTNEKYAPEKANNIVQDLTYVAILEDVGNSRNKKGLVKKPEAYNPKDFECACKSEEDEMFGAVTDCQQMLNYAKLPTRLAQKNEGKSGHKYMINWPNCGNDFYLNWPELSVTEREAKLKEAKNFTLGFVYYIQNQLGFKNLRLSDEFDTKDMLPFIPYDREARRVRGEVFLTVNHLEKPYEYNLYKTGVVVGDYPIDHHHKKNLDAPEIDFINIRVPSYNIPLGSLIPKNIDNFIVAEKNISVSNIVNGTTRLQPVVLGIGQAAGVLAAISVKENKNPNEISVRQVQNSLLKNGAYIMPFIDTKPSDKAFASMQRIGAMGILKGVGVPYKWANETWFYPERTVSEVEWINGLKPCYNVDKIPASGKGITLKFIQDVIKRINPDYSINSIKTNWKKWNIEQELDGNISLNRRTISILTDKILNPFEIEIDLQGYILKK
ncbi:FAD-dependent oxidoreductase [Aureibaculum sp. 2210JD6-5]|uniref:FAD-dependent oxidoreductase n=1 Tax=Aureibaculum sp. 2210JD6-5 TaxID=3103957 RepID=UPI002AADBE5E|nr:FAD-dependent oxidoreductase [Aureibaculum sp. 2210JD6-5]MDY7394302.1 FAD-dependent oxidoreductase [Aureibaculum sp. 2210JD6-5]